MPKKLLDRLQTFNRDRLPALVALKYRHMRANPFVFFRGSCHLFYEDWPASSELNAAPLTWLCGDLHLENFGTYKGENRLTYFDLNDFDDGALGPCTWDLARLLTSLHLAGAQINLADADLQALGAHLLDHYYAALAKGAILSLERATATGLLRQLMRTLKTRPRSKFLDQRSQRLKKSRRFKLEADRYGKVSETEVEQITAAFHALGEAANAGKFFKVHDIAFRVAGTGSLGLKRYAILVEGRGSPNENFILDLKAARPAPFAARLNVPQPEWPSQAHRMVAIQTRMQAMPPALLTPLEMGGDWYLVRELQPSQDKISLSAWDKRPEKIKNLLARMAEIVAWDQLRSGGRNGSAIADELIAFGESATLKNDLLAYAQSYARQVEKDFEKFAEAYDAGKLK